MFIVKLDLRIIVVDQVVVVHIEEVTVPVEVVNS
jgi:hypothetical protein